MNPLPRNRRTGAFERRVARALDGLVSHVAPVLVACSGGADSTATLVAVVRTGRTVIAAHFDHRLRTREEADADRAAVRALASALDIPLRCGEGSGASAAEAAARQERYHWLAAAAADADVEHVVTGHTLDDQAETVLLHLVRGAGLTGAAGMAPSAPWPVAVDQPLQLVRPLLGIERREVEAYIAALGLEPRHDPSNEDTTYSRNRIRQRVLPELRVLNPQVAHALAFFAERAARDAAALDDWAEISYRGITIIDRRRIVFDRATLLPLPAAIRTRVLRRAAQHIGTALSSAHLQAAELAIRHTGAAIALPGARLRTTDRDVILEIVSPTS